MDTGERASDKDQQLQAMLSNAQIGPFANIGEEDIVTGEQLGSGGFSVVYEGTWLGTPVAVKKWFYSRDSEEKKHQIRCEIMCNAGLRHPNVVTFCGACTDVAVPFMVCELLPFTLLEVLYSMPNVALPLPKVLGMAMQICHAFCYLHSRRPQLEIGRGIFYRDLKPHNLLLDRAWKVKVCDFGLASHCKENVGTPAYMAPELLRGDCFTDKVDIYAFGILLNEMVTRRPPFSGMEPQRINTLVLRGDRPDIPQSVPCEVKSLIQQCWDGSPTARPEFKNIQSRMRDALIQLGG